jgi:hypothetical protein
MLLYMSEFTWDKEFSGYDAWYRASTDPLTPVALLRELYELNDSEVWCDLAANPSLPLGILEELLAAKVFGLDLTLILNPQLTLMQVKALVSAALSVDLDALDRFESTIEIFDALMVTGAYKESYVFTSALLCNPHVSAEDFNVRVKLHAHVLNDEQFFADARLDMSNWAYFLNPNPWARRGLLHNPSIPPELLVHLRKKANRSSEPKIGLSNLNCPIELSASYHLEKLDDYRWSPSYLLGLEAKVNEHLILTTGDGPWEDLPLSWKLRMLAE